MRVLVIRIHNFPGHVIQPIIIWQTQSLSNPCALIGSFSVRILQYGPFPWKRSNPCIFVLDWSRQIQNLQSKQRKKKNCENCPSSQWNYQKKLKRLKFFQNFKDGWSWRIFSKWVLLSWRSGNFWCRNWNRHHQKPGCHIIDNLLTELAGAVLGIIGPRSWPGFTQSLLPVWPEQARLVSG